jgi:hypothetical protein
LRGLGTFFAAENYRRAKVPIFVAARFYNGLVYMCMHTYTVRGQDNHNCPLFLLSHVMLRKIKHYCRDFIEASPPEYGNGIK